MPPVCSPELLMVLFQLCRDINVLGTLLGTGTAPDALLCVPALQSQIGLLRLTGISVQLIGVANGENLGNCDSFWTDIAVVAGCAGNG